MSSICSPLSERVIVHDREFRRLVITFFVPLLLWTINLTIVMFGLPFLIVGWLRR